MCGRYALGATIDQVAARFGVTGPSAAATAPRYNLAPSQANPVVKRNGAPHLALMNWGLIPAWSKEPTTRYAMINARIETVAEKPSYRTPLRRQRCLVPATGYYEWQAPTAGGARAVKQPFFIGIPGADPSDLFAFAGLYDTWRGPDGRTLQTYTILTTAAAPLLAPIHDRMPVILPREVEAVWLDPQISDPDDVLALLHPYLPAHLVAYPVTTAVNSPAHEGPELVAMAAGTAPLFPSPMA